MYSNVWVTLWCNYLRHCAASRKVAGPIPDGVIGIFHGQYISGRTIALESTQSRIKVISRNIFWSVKATSV